MRTAKKGDWVRVHTIVMPVGERAPQIPDETKAVPLEMWVNGFLVDEKADIGKEAVISTLAGRELRGVLTDIEPVYGIDYGRPQPELLTIGLELRAVLKEISNG